MPDRDDASEEMKNRLANRFGGEPSEGSEREQSSERDGKSEPDMSASPDQTDESEAKVQNVKKEWDGWYIYLPDELGRTLDSEFDRLKYECGRDLDWKPKKNRHYYPVVIEAGLKAVEEMDAEDFTEKLDELGLR